MGILLARIVSTKPSKDGEKGGTVLKLKNLINIARSLDIEEKRRVTIRLVTSLMQFILGPSLAWKAGGSNSLGAFNGLALYVLIHLYSRFVAAYIASRGTERANNSYKFSPAFLAIAAACCLVNEFGLLNDQLHLILAVIIVPILLGSYEGAYWCSYHGINSAKKGEIVEENPSEAEKKRLKEFQMLEVLSTFTSAIFVFLLTKTIPVAQPFIPLPSPETVASMFALILAILATKRSNFEKECPVCEAEKGKACIITPQEDKELHFRDVHKVRMVLLRKDISPESEEKGNRFFTYNVPTATTHNDWYSGQAITGSIGIMQWSVSNAMRMVSLPFGGISTLSLLVGFAGLAGWVYSENLEKKIERMNKQSDYQVWILAHKWTTLGILIMGFSLLMTDPKSPEALGLNEVILFTIGWLIARAAMSGSIRRSEMEFANKFLKIDADNKEHTGSIIGVRERMKFEKQVQFSIAVIVCFYMHSFIGMSVFKWVALMLLFWAILICIYSIWRTGELIKKRIEIHSINSN